MVRIIAPACPVCKTQMRADMIYAELDNLERVDPIDINLAHWIVSLNCPGCRLVIDRRVGDCKAPLGGPAGVKE